PGVQRVFNPTAAGGGADGEISSRTEGARTAEQLPGVSRAILQRGPELVRHRNRAVTAADYEQLARAASPGVAAPRASTPGQTGCVVQAGTVRVVVVPHAAATEAEPAPDAALLERVRAYLQARAPAGVRVAVAGPSYYPIGVVAVVVPKDRVD